MMKIIRIMIWGLFFSLATSYGTMTMLAVLNKDIVYSGTHMLEEFIIAIVLGPVIGLGSILLLFERFPFLVRLLFHFSYVTACVLTAGQIGGWYVDQGPLSIWNVLIIEVFIYALVWLILNIMTQRDIDEINQKIKKNGEAKG